MVCGMVHCSVVISSLGISAEDLIKSLGDTAMFGSLKKLLKQVDEVDVVDVR